jgi:thiamine biosynthesis lipoprotein
MPSWNRFAALLAGAGAVASLAAPAQAQAWRFRANPVLGTSLDLVAIAADRAQAKLAADAARAEIARLDALLSGWRADSELARLNAAASLTVSPDLFAVLAACERWRAVTGGAFDARQGDVFALRRAAAGHGVVPDADMLRRLWTAAGACDVGLDAATRTVTRPQAVRFAPEALAKGYVVDAALAAARIAAPGVCGLMIDIGGDLRCWGQGPSGRGWTVGVADPAETADNASPAVMMRADGRALATSGPRDDGYNHIAGGAAGRRASVIAPTAAEADALATALCAMPVQTGLALVETLPGVEARVAEASGAARVSSGWSATTVSAPEPPARLIRAADSLTAPWPTRFALTIDYELPSRGGRAYSPYVAIWITDENNQLVRALTMLGAKLDYVSENYIWWRRYGRARPQIVAAISRPTRHAGRYSAVWDGKDDLGQPVGQGRYTVHVEAVREKGLHSYQAMELMLAGDPVQAMAPAGDELGDTMVRYGRR